MSVLFLHKNSWLGSLYAPLTLNAYAYCVNDPIQLFDPRGEWFDTVLDFVGSIYDISKGDWVGAIIGIVGLLIPCIPSSAIRAIRKALENSQDDLHRGGHLGVKIRRDGQRKGKERIPLPPCIL